MTTTIISNSGSDSTTATATVPVISSISALGVSFSLISTADHLGNNLAIVDFVDDGGPVSAVADAVAIENGGAAHVVDVVSVADEAVSPSLVTIEADVLRAHSAALPFSSVVATLFQQWW